MVYNPSLRQIPRDQPAAIIPLQQNASILDWLETTGRLIPRDPVEVPASDDEEITDLMGNEDNFEEEEDDDLELED
ncbi:MAG: DUF3134 family protein [Leptolyngbyaceae cyanobacterium SM1_1_3]|nr:DUF3134 family protein [Leptolyngbyaceae cyanobacterium SM1_1_3]NJN03264.1 DUF3134 family protein [Leptolyngbyaceae cyanobacterium RM1_1_2]NJO11977.1 DUF3134 family protein [Leptolyngbyaceae cyanobacterium SL_1_1]